MCMPQRHCGNCGEPITDHFHKVMSDPETGEVRACPSCDVPVQRAYRA